MFIRILLVLYVWPKRGLMMTRLVATNVGQRCQPMFLPYRSACQIFGRSPHLAYLHGKDLLVLLHRFVCRGLVVPLCGLVRRGLGRSLRLVDSLGGNLVVCHAS